MRSREVNTDESIDSGVKQAVKIANMVTIGTTYTTLDQQHRRDLQIGYRRNYTSEQRDKPYLNSEKRNYFF